MPIDLRGKTICFTGTLSSMTRNEAKGVAYKFGARVTDTIGLNVDYLVVGDNPGSKLRTAKARGISILNDQQWSIIGGVEEDRVYREQVGKPIKRKTIDEILKPGWLNKSIQDKSLQKVKNDFPELDLD